MLTSIRNDIFKANHRITILKLILLSIYSKERFCVSLIGRLSLESSSQEARTSVHLVPLTDEFIPNGLKPEIPIEIDYNRRWMKLDLKPVED